MADVVIPLEKKKRVKLLIELLASASSDIDDDDVAGAIAKIMKAKEVAKSDEDASLAVRFFDHVLDISKKETLKSDVEKALKAVFAIHEEIR